MLKNTAILQMVADLRKMKRNELDALFPLLLIYKYIYKYIKRTLGEDLWITVAIFSKIMVQSATF
jgi:hypothetical protein